MTQKLVKIKTSPGEACYFTVEKIVASIMALDSETRAELMTQLMQQISPPRLDVGL